jgi:hypothetical protein
MLLPFLFYTFTESKFDEPYYGKRINRAYTLTLEALKELSERNELDKPIVLCFPYQLFSLNEMGLYPSHPYQITHYNKFNIKDIDQPYFYFICRPDIKEDAYYKEYFKDLDREKILFLGSEEENLEIWRFFTK